MLYPPPSQISRILLSLLLILVLFYILMDVNLYLRIQNYPIDRGYNKSNISFNYNNVSWLGYNISPLGDVTVKAVLLDHTNLYVFGPLITILDSVLDISNMSHITPNAISFFHVFIAVISGKFVSDIMLTYRRIGVVLFQIRTILDDLDGHVARVRKNIRGERSEVGTSGYYIDGICDSLGITALLLGSFLFLKDNPPRRGYFKLPTIVDSKDADVIIPKSKVTNQTTIVLFCCFIFQLVLSSSAWNRYIDLYQDLLENNDVSRLVFEKQNIIFQSTNFFIVAWLWRIVNVHNMLHCFLVAVFCDKMFEFLKFVQYLGFVVLIMVICFTEYHIVGSKNYIFFYANQVDFMAR